MTQEALVKRIKTTTDLRDIVTTMKMLSSVSVGQFEKALKSLDQYTKNINLAFQGLFVQEAFVYKQPVIKHTKQPKLLSIVIGSDNGLVGRFNRDVIDFMTKSLENKTEPKQIRLLTVGKRMALQAPSLKYSTLTHYNNSNSVNEISSLADTLLTKIDQIVSKEKYDEVWIYYNTRTDATLKTKAQCLIPFDVETLMTLQNKKWPGKSIPLTSENLSQLFSSLIHEHLTIQIANALTASLAAEHYTRMTHMQQAEKNIDDKLNELNLIYQQERQNQITDELIDIVSGAEAINKILDKKEKNS